MKNSFKIFNKLKEIIDGYKSRVNNIPSGDPPMNKFRTWIKENKIYFSIWLIIAYLAIWVSISLKVDISGEIKYEIKYKQPWVVEKILSNKN